MAYNCHLSVQACAGAQSASNLMSLLPLPPLRAWKHPVSSSYGLMNVIDILHPERLHACLTTCAQFSTLNCRQSKLNTSQRQRTNWYGQLSVYNACQLFMQDTVTCALLELWVGLPILVPHLLGIMVSSTPSACCMLLGTPAHTGFLGAMHHLALAGAGTTAGISLTGAGAPTPPAAPAHPAAALPRQHGHQPRPGPSPDAAARRP